MDVPFKFHNSENCNQVLYKKDNVKEHLLGYPQLFLISLLLKKSLKYTFLNFVQKYIEHYLFNAIKARCNKIKWEYIKRILNK